MCIKKTQDFVPISNPLKKLQKVAFYDTHIKFLPKIFFAYNITYFLLTLMVNTDETAEKNLFYKCVLDVSGLGGSILSKKVKIVAQLIEKKHSSEMKHGKQKTFFILLKYRLHLVLLEPAVRECRRNRAPQSNNLKSKSIFCNICTTW
jgi:hypothetical protein